MKPNAIWMGYDIETSGGPVLQPTRISVWNQNQFKSAKPESPFYFKADALLGLSLIHLNQHLKNPFSSPKMNFSFAHEAWLTFEPHIQLFARAQPRLNTLNKKMAEPKVDQSGERFDSQLTEILDSSLHEWGVDLIELAGLVKCIDKLEIKTSSPLLFNFGLKLNKSTIEKLHYIHSLLFNLRALIAVDYNAYIQDVAYQSVRVDSISDYLPKSDYITNDAAIYWNFKKMQDSIPAPAFEKLDSVFNHFSHNAVCLIDRLPKSYLGSLPASDLENAIYLSQMDWLLGTEAGLLFRIREELYGLVEGYQHVFWHELEGKAQLPSHKLAVNCQVTDRDLSSKKDVA